MKTENRENDINKKSNVFYEVENPNEVYNTYQNFISSENFQAMVQNTLKGI